VPLLVDGNNLAHRLAGGADRTAVRQKVLDFVRGQQVSVIVFFDGPPPAGTPDREVLGRATMIYCGRRSADDAIVHQIPQGHDARNFTVITDDRGLARRVRNAGGRVLSLPRWIQRLHRQRPAPSRPSPEAPLPPSEISEWERYFASGRTNGGED